MTATELSPTLAGDALPWRRPAPDDGTPRVVAVTGGSGGAAAVVADVAELGERFASAARDADPGTGHALLAGAALQVQGLATLAPAQVVAAQEGCAVAATRLLAAVARLEALAAATRLAAQAYAGTEEAVTRSWHVVTHDLALPALLVAVSTGIAHEVGHVRVGRVEALATEAALDGAAQHLVGDADPAGRTDVVAPSALRTATGVLAGTYPGGGGRAEPVDGPTLPPAAPGLAGAVAGVADVAAARRHEPLVAARHRRLDGPDGHREAYVVELPGTDPWDPPWNPSASPTDLGSDLAQLGGLPDDAYVQAVLRVLDDAPPGATVVLVGHSLGGITASTVAALAAQRGRRVDYVVTAGSPVDTMRVPVGTTVVSLANDADLVPAADGMPARDVAGRTTVTVHADTGSARGNHEARLYAHAARAVDERARTDPGLRLTTERMRRAGALVGEGDTVTDETTWYRLTRTPPP